METLTVNFADPNAARYAATKLINMPAVHHLYHYHRPKKGRLVVRPYLTDITPAGIAGLIAGITAGLLSAASYWFRFSYPTLLGFLVIFTLATFAGLFLGLISGIASQPSLLDPGTEPIKSGDTLKLVVKPEQVAEVEAVLRRLQSNSGR